MIPAWISGVPARRGAPVFKCLTQCQPPGQNHHACAEQFSQTVGQAALGERFCPSSQQATKKDAGEESNVSITPNISRAEKVSFLAQLSVLSVPVTYGEAFGLYVIEAMAAGTPVVQPRSGAFPELIEMTEGGVLCDPGSAESLANSLEELLLQPEQSLKMGEQGRENVHKLFSADAMANNTLNAIYDFAPSLKVHYNE